MNILFVAPRLPLPADTGGKIRTLNILKQIAKANKVVLLCFSFEVDDAKYQKELEGLGIECHLVPMKDTPVWRKIFNVLFSSVPHSIAKYRTKLMRKKVEALLSGSSFDAVHVDHLHMAHYAPGKKSKVFSVLDEHNVEYKILERCAKVERSPVKKMVYMGQAVKMHLFEAHQAQQFRGVFTCSEDDRSILNKITNGMVPIHVIPNGVDTEYFQAQDTRHPSASPGTGRTQDQEDAMVFTGSMDWLPNDDAITYFCAQILPLIWKENKNIKLYVVGKSPSASVRELAAQDRRVIVTGRVEDVRPYIEKAKIFIVPLRIGGGTRLKILEAMAMNKATVSTSIGAEGIEYTDGVNIAIADAPDHFARSVVSLIENDKISRALGEAGRCLVCEKYDWNVIGKKIKILYQGSLK